MTHIIPISAYTSRWSKKQNRFVPGAVPHDTDFYTEMEHIKAGTHAALIDALRALPDKEARDAFKAEKLPSITVSCTTHTWRKLENVVAHSGLLNIDIDGKGNPQFVTTEDWARFRDELGQLDYVVAAWLSASGLGVTFVVRVQPDPEAHKLAFDSLLHDLKKYKEVQVDKGVHDVTRLRFVSHDPDMVLKHDFEAIPVYYGSNKKKMIAEFSAIDFVPTTELDTDHNFQECMKHAEKKGYSFADGQKHYYLASMAGKCNALGMSQAFVEGMVLQTFGAFAGIPEDQLLQPIRNIYRSYVAEHGSFRPRITTDTKTGAVIVEESAAKQLFVEAARANYTGLALDSFDWALTGPQYGVAPEEAQRIFEKVYRQNEDEHGMASKPDIVRVEHYLKKKYDFAKNEVTLQRSYRVKGDTEWLDMTEEEIWRDLTINGFKFDLNKVKAIMKTSFVNVFNPFLDYFESLPAWDPEKDPDYITQLAGHIQTDNQPFFETQFKKCLVRSIACGLGDDVNRIVFTFVGEKQETGKSSFIRFLNPFGKEYYEEAPIRDNKDSEFKFAENFIYNLEELAALNNVEVNRLKAIISIAQVKQRKAYASAEVRQVRRCNFWASTNKADFLTDTENTRWLCFNVLSIDYSYANIYTGESKVDIHKVWSQAYALYKAGISHFDYRLTKEEGQMRAIMNKSYELNTPEKELILMYIKPASEDKWNRHYFMNATSILHYLSEKTNNRIKLNHITVGKTLMQLEFPPGRERLNGYPVKGFYVEKITMPGEEHVVYDPEPEDETASIPYFGVATFHKENDDEDLPF